MKQTCTTIAMLLAASLQAVPRYWEADVRSPAAFQTAAYRGETVQLTARLVRGRAPFEVPEGASAKMLVSTNDFLDGRCWEWPAAVSTGGVVRATWTPDMDPGGPAVRIFLAVSESGTNINYGANCTMRLLGSPGAVPNELPPPTQSIDFSTLALYNAPWPDFGATSNIVSDAIAGIDFPDTSLEPATNYTDAVALRVAGDATNYTDAAIAAIDIPDPDYSFTNDFVKTEYDPRFSEWLETGFEMDVDAYVSPALDQAMAYTDAVADGLSPTGHVHDAADIASGTLSADRIPPLAASKITSGTLAAARIPGLAASKITSGTIAAARLPLATATTVGAVRPDGGTTTVASGVLSAQPALDSAMSYTDVSIGSITNSEFVATNGTLALYAPWNGVMTNVWSSDAFAKTADISALLSELQSLAARVRALEQNSGAGAQFWNRYAASGAANPDYENITVLNRAMTMFAAGFDIETSGAYGVFVQSGTMAFPSGGDGHFRLGVGTNAWFGIEVGGSVMVGAVAQSINVGEGVVFIDYPYSGTGDFPTIEMCTSLALMDWTTITPEWYDNGDGTATATCPATASSGFYRGWTSVTMSTRFSTTLPFEAKGGILCDDKIHVAYPVYNNGTITWSAQ